PLALGGDESDLLTLGVAGDQMRNITTVAVEARLVDGTTLVLSQPREASEWTNTTAGISIALEPEAAQPAIDQIRVTLKLREASGMVSLRHIALHPADSVVTGAR